MSEVAEQPNLSTEEIKKRALRQVEFYFGDANLPYDKFFWDLTRKNDGWVPIKVLMTFKRMRAYQPFELVVEALRESKSLLEVSEDGTKVRRKEPLVETPGRVFRSIYAKGFGEETPTLQFELEDFFAKFGDCRAVRMRRTDDKEKKFKGSVFVEFGTQEEAEKIAQMKLEYNGQELEVMTKGKYIEIKKEKYANEPSAPHKPPPFNAFREMRESQKSQKAPKRPLHLIKYSGCGASLKVNELKAELAKHIEIYWVAPANGEGFIELKGNADENAAIEKLNAASIELGGVKTSFSIPTDEEKESYTQQKQKRSKDDGAFGGKNRGTKRKMDGKHQKRGEKKEGENKNGSETPDESAAKKLKTEEEKVEGTEGQDA
ncbi:uncharacterized protein VTP21DRAFT_10166 [Calcarisporiella thermophila]|uniref:uncharacterized protein n=1 Tax=Calcarisporiella thermophila TaxID=911321 RepID=UPI003743B393